MTIVQSWHGFRAHQARQEFWGFMARIADSELERLKVEVSLVALVEAKGIALRKHGADLVGRCPFHDDQGPSFVVSVSKNLWRCHGGVRWAAVWLIL